MRAFDNIKFVFGLVCITLTFGACNITKELRSSQALLYNGSKVKITGEKREDVKAPIPDLVKQTPNKRFLGITKLKLRFYYLGLRSPDTKIGALLMDKFGEPPVLLDTAFIESSVKSMRAYLHSVGFYYPEITYKVKQHRLRAFVTYYINTNQVYHINKYRINCADRDLYDLIKSTEKESVFTSGYRLNNERLLQEEKRIVTLLRNHGYYSFNNDYISFDVDTAFNNWTVDVALNIQNRGMYEPHQKYYVKNVNINIEPISDSINNTNTDTIKSKTFNYIPNSYKLNASILEQNTFLNPGSEFVQNKVNRTYQRLGDLNLFKLITVNATTYTLNDTPMVDYGVRLIPNIKYDYTIEPQAIISDQNNSFTEQSRTGNYGVAAIVTFNSRNSFRNAELFKLSFRTSVEVQGKANTARWFNATEQSLTAGLTFPRLVAFPKLDRNINFINTKTTFTTSAIYELNANFERRVATAGIIYQINKKNTSYYFTPFEISFTKNSINSHVLLSLIKNDIYLYNMFSNNLILGGRMGLVYTNKEITKTKHYIYLRFDALEISGNTATIINKLIDKKLNATGNYNIFDVNYSQFAKTAIDFRFNKRIDPNNFYVFRVYSGVGIPYGNSPKFLPFERRFWVGGANSLRAWLPRSLGPGSSYQPGQIDYSGDIKLEANAEFRFNMYHKWLEGAVFADAGNVWMSKMDVNRTGAEFDFNRFYKEFGVGSGYGVRLNFDIILIRFDLAIPIYDPSSSLSNPWVVKDFSGKWVYNNVNLTFGIGYPF